MANGIMPPAAGTVPQRPPVAPPPGPQGSPMAQPSPNPGAMAKGAAKVTSAMQLLDRALAELGSNTEEGKSVLRALSSLSQKFNRPKDQGLVPAQLREQIQAAQPSPMQALMMKQAAAPQGGATAGPPPGMGMQ